MHRPLSAPPIPCNNMFAIPYSFIQHVPHLIPCNSMLPIPYLATINPTCHILQPNLATVGSPIPYLATTSSPFPILQPYLVTISCNHIFQPITCNNKLLKIPHLATIRSPSHNVTRPTSCNHILQRHVPPSRPVASLFVKKTEGLHHYFRFAWQGR